MSTAVVQILLKQNQFTTLLWYAILAVQGSNSNRVTPICEDE